MFAHSWPVVVVAAFVLASFSAAQSADIPNTISAEARFILETRTPETIAGELTPETAQQIRDDREAERAESNAKLKDALLEPIESISLNGVPALLITPRGYDSVNDEKAAIYLHGGGYVLGDAFDSMAAYMAAELGLKVYSIEYRLAPEHPYPAGLDDCVEAYAALLKEFHPENLVMFGVSAGGGMTLATILRARDEGYPMPAAAGLVTPWCDLTHTGDAYFANDGRDPILTWTDQLDRMSGAYAGNYDPKDPLVSPVYADFTKGFPPSFISTGTRDLLLSDCARLHQAMRQAGIRASLGVWEGMWHAFQIFPIPEGEKSRKELAGFLLDALKE